MSLKKRMVNFVVGLMGFELSRKNNAWKLIEPEQLKRFLSAFSIDCVFDVGANYGQYATMLREIGFQGQIISFEPNPDAAKKLKNAAAGDLKWAILETALDQEQRSISFNIMKESMFSSLHEPDHSGTQIFNDMNSIERQVTLTTDTLSDLFPKLKSKYGFKRPYLKMDTQGHDTAVALGAGAYIAEFIGLQSELNIVKLYKNSLDMSEALDIYRRLGFKMSALVPNNEGHFPDLNEVDCIMYNKLHPLMATQASRVR